MWRTLAIGRSRRVARIRDGVYATLYGPGRHWVWTGWTFNEWIDVDTSKVLPVQAGDPLPDRLSGTAIVEVAPTERVVLRVAGRVTQVLSPGRWRVWDELGAEVIRVDLRATPVALDDEDRLVPSITQAWAEMSASDTYALVLRRDGATVGRLSDGRYRIWSEGPWSVLPVLLARSVLDVAAQDLVTSDQVPVRVKPAATFRVSDPVTRARETEAETEVYGAVQLALRELVASRTLDQLVTEREALSTELLTRARAALPNVGLMLEQVFVKDVVLPGEIRDLVNRVTLARKEAEALAIKRREEVAATRQLANTAKLLEQSPVLLRLKELEVLAEIASHIDKLVVVGGADLTRPLLLREME